MVAFAFMVTSKLEGTPIILTGSEDSTVSNWSSDELRKRKNELNRKSYQCHRDERLVQNREYYQKHREERKKYYQEHKGEILAKRKEYRKGYYQQHKERLRVVCKINKERYREKYPEKYLENTRRYALVQRRKLKLEVFTHYSRGLPRCASCDEGRLACLSIDHINGRSSEEKRKTGLKGATFYRWLKVNGYPNGFQVLCMNCQWIKRNERREYNHWSGTTSW